MSASVLKLIALIFMVIDHIGHFFPEVTPMWFRLLGRISAPIFFFLFIEGYTHTSNKRNYQMRLFIYSVIMFLTNIGLMTVYNILNIKSVIINPLVPNIFVTLSVCFLILNVIERLKLQKGLTQIANLIFAFITLTTILAFTEYHALALFMTLIFYFLRDKKLFRNVVYISGSILLPYLLMNYLQMAMVLALIFINEYNGTLNNKPKENYNKMFFYNFYIIHIVILALISLLIQKFF